MYFLPELRGHGIGSAFLHRLVAFARDAGFEKMELETASVLHAAIALYRRRGFEEIGNKRDIERCDRAFVLALANYRPPAGVARLGKRAARA
jgi:ribosomal protein S18 acetylase RimI-like enzyme